MQEVSKFAAIIGVVRDEKVVKNAFDPSFTLKQNDTMLVLGNSEELEAVEKEARAL